MFANQPGLGGIEAGETPEDAVARECSEELGQSFLISLFVKN